MALNIEPNQVLLLKSQDSEKSPNHYANLFKANGYEPKTLTVLDFEYTNLETLRTKLNHPAEYSGIIFTSPRAARATIISLKNQKIDSWKGHLIYVVGESTQSILQNELDLQCLGSNTGSASKLAEFITKDKTQFSKPLLFPCGNMNRDTLPLVLQEADIQLDIVTVYKTIPSPCLKLDFDKLIEDNTVPNYFIYFSPSGVQFTKEIIEKNNLPHRVKFIAIGRTTAEELKSIGWKVAAVAEKPTPESLLETFQDL